MVARSLVLVVFRGGPKSGCVEWHNVDPGVDVPIGQPASHYRRRTPMAFLSTRLGAALVLDYVEPDQPAPPRAAIQPSRDIGRAVVGAMKPKPCVIGESVRRVSLGHLPNHRRPISCWVVQGDTAPG